LQLPILELVFLKRKIDTIFDNFQASTGTSRLYGGTLGLAIVKQLVEPQGGVINVE
jgi:signal transduction histidine kinase